MLFTKIMSKNRIYIYSVIGFLLLIGFVFFNPNKFNQDFLERVKVSFRDIGHQLLLVNNDSTSLVLPIIALDKSKYKISFQSKLSINPDSLNSIVQRSLKKANLPKYYRTEVIQCINDEVNYSFEIKDKKENSIIPCRGRILPVNCYTIEIKFTQKTSSFISKQLFLVGLILLLIVFLLDFNLLKQKEIKKESNGNHLKVGIFQFYPEQNKLVKQANEINLSKKECELLAIFVENLNEVINRDELMKRVWEDNGVFVGRSLDTYISKLRKKLKEDTSIKITNVHGVGYKLETN